jgi:hypothetical protein
MCIIKKETQNRDYYICIVSVFDASADQNLKGIVSPDWKGLQMVSLDRFEV